MHDEQANVPTWQRDLFRAACAQSVAVQREMFQLQPTCRKCRAGLDAAGVDSLGRLHPEPACTDSPGTPDLPGQQTFA